MASYCYEGPSPTRDQCRYFIGELSGLRDFWPAWDLAVADHLQDVMPTDREPVFVTLCDTLGIPMELRAPLWYEVLTD